MLQAMTAHQAARMTVLVGLLVIVADVGQPGSQAVAKQVLVHRVRHMDMDTRGRVSLADAAEGAMAGAAEPVLSVPPFGYII